MVNRAEFQVALTRMLAPRTIFGVEVEFFGISTVRIKTAKSEDLTRAILALEEKCANSLILCTENRSNKNGCGFVAYYTVAQGV